MYPINEKFKSLFVITTNKRQFKDITCILFLMNSFNVFDQTRTGYNDGDNIY